MVSLFRAPEEGEDRWRFDYDKVFDDAKKFSDFLGMIVRSIFFSAGSAFCYVRIKDGQDEGEIFYGITLLVFLLLSFAMLVKTGRVMIGYLQKGVRIKWRPIEVFVLALIQLLGISVFSILFFAINGFVIATTSGLFEALTEVPGAEETVNETTAPQSAPSSSSEVGEVNDKEVIP